jgi:hypothetical protein
VWVQQIDRFGWSYNTVRPHRSLGRRTPEEAFCARPKATPQGPQVVIAPNYRVRKDKVDITGVITLRHNSRLPASCCGTSPWIRATTTNPTGGDARMSRDRCERCLETSQWWPRQESNLRHTV